MLNDGYRSRSPTSNLHHKRHSRSLCLPACFSSMSSTHPFDVLENEADHYYNNHHSSRRARTPPPRSTLPEIKGRCLNLISMIGGRIRRRYASADFSYDPSSYALNFEDDASRADDQILLSARLSTSSIPTTSPLEKPISRHHLDDISENEECVATATEKKGKSRANSVVPRRRGRSRHSSSSMDFSYEPSSYARNFEDDMNDEVIALRKFGGQLAAPSKQSLTTTTTPPPAKCSTLRPEIAAFS